MQKELSGTNLKILSATGFLVGGSMELTLKLAGSHFQSSMDLESYQLLKDITLNS